RRDEGGRERQEADDDRQQAQDQEQPPKLTQARGGLWHCGGRGDWEAHGVWILALGRVNNGERQVSILPSTGMAGGQQSRLIAIGCAPTHSRFEWVGFGNAAVTPRMIVFPREPFGSRDGLRPGRLPRWFVRESLPPPIMPRVVPAHVVRPR